MKRQSKTRFFAMYLFIKRPMAIHVPISDLMLAVLKYGQGVQNHGVIAEALFLVVRKRQRRYE
jgi:hypothetical protein